MRAFCERRRRETDFLFTPEIGPNNNLRITPRSVVLKTIKSVSVIREPPDVGLVPSALWTVSPPSPNCTGGLKPWPFSPHPPPPSSPHPLASFCDAPGEGGPGWRARGVLGREGVEGEAPPSGTWGQTHIWGYSSNRESTSLNSKMPRVC